MGDTAVGEDVRTGHRRSPHSTALGLDSFSTGVLGTKRPLWWWLAW